MAPRYGPPDAFARAPLHGCPHVRAAAARDRDRTDVDAAVVGVPFDTATSFRAGRALRARGDPRRARSLLRPCHPPLEVDVFASQSLVDWGDLDGHARQRGADRRRRSHAGLRPLVAAGRHAARAGRRPLDRARRAAGARRAPRARSALVLLDAHADTWDQYYGERYFHGTPFRRALEEGLLAPERSTPGRACAGRSTRAADLADAARLGFEIAALRRAARRCRPPSTAGACASASATGPLFLSFDIDVDRPGVRARDGHAGGRRACCRTRRSRSCARSPGCAFTRLRRRRGRARPTTAPVSRPPLLAASLAYELLRAARRGSGYRVCRWPRSRRPAAHAARRPDRRLDRAARAVPAARAQRGYGDAFTIRIGGEPPWVMLAHPDAVREVFTGDPALLHAGKANVMLRPLVGRASVLLLDGPSTCASAS